MKFRPTKAAPDRAGETPKQTDPNANGAGAALEGWNDKAFENTMKSIAASEFAHAIEKEKRDQLEGDLRRSEAMIAGSRPVLLTKIMPEPEPDFDSKGGFVTAYAVAARAPGSPDLRHFPPGIERQEGLHREAPAHESGKNEGARGRSGAP